MSKRTKDEMDMMGSVAGVLATAVALLRATVIKLGGNFSHVHRLTTPEGAETVEKIANLIVGKPAEAPVPSPNWWITMLAAFVKVCGFTWMNQNVNGENFHFPCTNVEPGQVEIVSIKTRLMELGRQWLTTAEVLAYLAELGYRPTGLLELLLWWLANPAKHADCLVVALGQLWRGSAPYVRGYGSRRRLVLGSSVRGWDARCGFVAVRKSKAA